MKRPFRRKRLDRYIAQAIGGKTIGAASLFTLNSEDSEELLLDASRRFGAGEIDAAEALYMLHLRLFGFTADAWLGAGACKQAEGKLARAVEAYSHALGERPGDPYALANLAECALLSDDPDRALKLLVAITTDQRSRIPTELAARVKRLEHLATQAIRVNSSRSGVGEGVEISPREGLSHVVFAVEPDLTAIEFRSVLGRSTLAERRPVHELGTIDGMLANADLIVTARIDGLLVGISRAITDFHFCTYLSDLAVDRDHQRKGIGRELIRRTHEAAGLKTTLILLAAPAAREYYPHIGMTAHDSCWIIPRTPPNEGKSQ